jgi:ADP-ribose pyrophosphatase YjhB (NUDIX family)
MEHKIIVICRGIIVDNDKMLVVENAKNNFFCPPGGKMEFGENPKQTTIREVEEELVVKPELGRLLYVNTYNDGKDQAVEFLYEILNIDDYQNIEKLKGSHGFELSKIIWINRDNAEKVLPSEIWQDFKENNLPKDTERYIDG